MGRGVRMSNHERHGKDFGKFKSEIVHELLELRGMIR